MYYWGGGGGFNTSPNIFQDRFECKDLYSNLGKNIHDDEIISIITWNTLLAYTIPLRASVCVCVCVLVMIYIRGQFCVFSLTTGDLRQVWIPWSNHANHLFHQNFDTFDTFLVNSYFREEKKSHTVN